MFSSHVVLPKGTRQVKLVYDGHNRYDFHAVDLWTRPTVTRPLSGGSRGSAGLDLFEVFDDSAMMGIYEEFMRNFMGI